MKDLIQEGRKIQETFKKKTVKEQTLNEAQWVSSGTSGWGDGVIEYRFNYKLTLTDRVSNFIDRLRKSNTIGSIPKVNEIYASYFDGKKEGNQIYIAITFSRELISGFGKAPFVENLNIYSYYPYTQYTVSANMFSEKRKEKIMNNQYVDVLVKQLISELKPEIEKAKAKQKDYNKVRNI